MKTIKLYNRYRDNTYLQKIDDSHYEFRYADDENADNFCRFGYDDDPKKPVFVDPPGGPFISVGENNLSVYAEGYSSVKVNVNAIEIEPDNNHVILTVSGLEMIS